MAHASQSIERAAQFKVLFSGVSTTESHATQIASVKRNYKSDFVNSKSPAIWGLR
jgi:hypothetical protein